MAIQAKIQTVQGCSQEQAYINIGTPQIKKEKQPDGTNKYTIGTNANIYSSQAYYDACILAKETPIPVEGFSVTCVLDLESNVLKQAYAELKLNTRLSNISEV